jgi:hypothetical protein
MGEFFKLLKRRFILPACFLLFIGAAVFMGKMDVSFNAVVGTENDFSGVISRNVGAEARVVDVAMLGAHDAFSSGITGKSRFDPADASPFNNNAAMCFGSGLISRMAKAQVSGAYDLLNRGVRYFDVRITRYDDNWYTFHGLISDKLETYLLDTLRFLARNPGEFIVFDIQHVNLGGNTFGDLFTFIDSVKIRGDNELSLFDFVTYKPDATPLGGLTVGEVTRDRAGAGVVILAKTPQYEGCKHYERNDFAGNDKAIRSLWHNKVTTAGILEGIAGEYALLNSADGRVSLSDMFRVNQAQTTPVFKGVGNILRSVTDWSLLAAAQTHNAKLVAHADFSKWLTVMPIFMVDFADSSKGDFNKNVLTKINEYNRLVQQPG